MLQKRIIPLLQIQNDCLVKSKNFKKFTYIGDPINSIRIFNDKFVNEILLVDINCTISKNKINYDLIRDIASECFIPLGYGGGVSSISDARKILNCGIEKIVINSHFLRKPNFILELSKYIGSQSVVVSIDYKYNIFRKPQVYSKTVKKLPNNCPIQLALLAESLGAGEIFINCITNDGTYNGLDNNYLKILLSQLKIPLIPCGGIGSFNHICESILAGFDTVSAGSYFVLTGKNKAVLISYLSNDQINIVNKL